jgi:PBSX family phage terminase large subunit
MIIVKTPTSPHTGEKPFQILYNLPQGTNTVICIGGRGGMKTHEVSKFVAYSSTIKQKRCVILRDEKSLVRESILNEILLRFDIANTNGKLSEYYDRLDTGIKIRDTNEMTVFTMGFRASAKAKKANLKSISNIDIAVIEEMEDIRDEEAYNTFSDSIRNEGSVIIMILNTPDINHFILKRYFNLRKPDLPEGWDESELDGFFEIVPKDLPGFVCIQTGFEDNPFLPIHIVEKYKGYGDKNSNFYNPFYYKTAIKGWASTGRKGQILTKVKPIKLADYLALPFPEIIGQDFGTNHPAGTVGVKFDGDNSYCRQLNYLPLNVKLLAKKYIELGIKDEIIIADSAEPFSVGKLRGGWEEGELSEEDIKNFPQLLQGWSVFGVVKAPGSVKTGLDKMDSMNLYAVEESTDLWNEIMNYIWATDANGNQTGEPLKAFDDLIDPWRYVIESRGRYF